MGFCAALEPSGPYTDPWAKPLVVSTGSVKPHLVSTRTLMPQNASATNSRTLSGTPRQHSVASPAARMMVLKNFS